MHINKKSLENFFLVFSLTLFLCVVIMPRAVSHFLVPDTKAETIQVYMKKTEELYQDILKDAEKGKTKNITDYSFTMLADSTFLQDSAFTEALLYNTPFLMKWTETTNSLFPGVTKMEFYGRSEGFTNQHIAEAEKKADEITAYINSRNCSSDRWEVTELLGYTREYAHYLMQDENFEENMTKKFAHEAWSCLISGEPVCDGYSRAVEMICEKLDVPCICVIMPGTAEKPGHQWNLIYLDGHWYHADFTNSHINWRSRVDFMKYMEKYPPDIAYTKYLEDSLAETFFYLEYEDENFFLVTNDVIRKHFSYDAESAALLIEAKYPELLEDYLKDL